MKECPLNSDMECHDCKMKFGPRDTCGIRSMAMDLSVLVEEGIPIVKEILDLAKRRCS